MKNIVKLLAVMVLGVAAASAQETQLQPGVARVSLIHGDVSVQRGDSGDWVAATLNTPVVNDDRISTGERSRTELQLDFANILRLDERSTARVANLSRTRIQMQIGQGQANFDVLKGSEADAEIDTPNVAIHPLREGRYRIRVISDSETEVIVRKGEADVTTPQGSTRVESGHMITIEGTDNPEYQTTSAPHKDDWDNWNGDRDGLIARAETWRYTDRYYTGASDLDAYGRWTTVPDYGPVWVPVVSPGWAPYRVGRWVWEPYYGWTWVSYEPWGWAPYHYGRWFLYAGSWCWWPGPVAFAPAYRPVWAPAYVSFFGFGGGISVGFGFGHIGWLPIGPADYYYPWYGYGVNRVHVTNVTNITNITNVNNINNINNITNVNNIHNGGGGGTGTGGLVTGSAAVAPLWRRATGHPYSNVRLAAQNDPRLIRAISAVPADHFGTGAARVQPVDSNTFRNGSVLTGRVPVVPSRESLRPVDKPVSPATIRASAANPQHFFTRTQPAPSVRPFNQEVAQMQKIIGDSARPQQNVGPSASPTAQPRVNTGAAAAGISRPATANVAAQPAMANKPAGQNGSPAVARPGWNRFGSDVAENRGDVAIRDQGSSKTADTTSRNNAQPKPQAGTAPRSAPANATRPGWHSFGSGNANANENRGRMNSQGNAVQRPNAAPATDMGTAAPAKAPARLSNDGQRNGGWQHFTPAEPAPRSESRGVSAPSGTPRGNAPAEEVRGGGWQRFTPRSEASPSMNPRSEVSPRSSGSERPPLDLRQPIVTRRSSPAVESGPRSAYGPGGMSRPSGYSRPAGGSSMGAPAPRSGGAPASHPGGGRPSGGGGAHPGASNSGGRPH